MNKILKLLVGVSGGCESVPKNPSLRQLYCHVKRGAADYDDSETSRHPDKYYIYMNMKQFKAA
jgi:hypothetical protein